MSEDLDFISKNTCSRSMHKAVLIPKSSLYTLLKGCMCLKIIFLKIILSNATSKTLLKYIKENGLKI